MRDLKYKGFEEHEELLEWVNSNKDSIDLVTITGQGMYAEVYAAWYYEKSS